MLTFVLPDERHRQNVLAFCAEFEETGGTCIGYGGWRDYDKWLQGMRNRHTGHDLPEGSIREDFYLCYEGDALIGVFSLKFELTPFLLNYGGHIGYAVRPSQQRRGLATEILKEGVALARSSGFKRLLLVCDDDNLAPEKVILKNGGQYENTLFDPDEQVFVKRYWIDC